METGIWLCFFAFFLLLLRLIEFSGGGSGTPFSCRFSSLSFFSFSLSLSVCRYLGRTRPHDTNCTKHLSLLQGHIHTQKLIFLLLAFLFNIQFLSDITHTLFFLQSTKRAGMFVGGDYYYTEAD